MTQERKPHTPLRHNGHNRAVGQRGEETAAQWLTQRGYQILARNWRCPAAELDIVAERDGEIIAVEVKTRASDRLGAPEEAITAAKQRKLVEAVQTYLLEMGAEERPYRIDVIAIRLGLAGAPDDIRHYPSAVSLDE